MDGLIAWVARCFGFRKEIAAVCQALEASEATFHRWRNQYGGIKAYRGTNGTPDISVTNSVHAAGTVVLNDGVGGVEVRLNRRSAI